MLIRCPLIQRLADTVSADTEDADTGDTEDADMEAR